MTVDGFVAVFAVARIEGIKPKKEVSVLNAVEFNKVALKVAVDDGALDATEEVFLSWNAEKKDMLPAAGEWELLCGGSSDKLQSVSYVRK